MQTNDYLQARAGAENRKYKEDYAAVGTAFAPAILSVTGRIHLEFLRLLWVLADKQTRNYYALIGAEEEIGSEVFTWSGARTIRFNKNSIGKAIAHATATGLHLSVHSTTPPSRRQPGQPTSEIPSEIQEFSLSYSSFSPTNGCLVIKNSISLMLLLHAYTYVLGASTVGGVAILRCPLAGLLALFPALLSLLLSLCHRAAVSTCRCKAKHRIVAPLRAPRLAVPHLSLMLTTRKPMHARMLSLQTGMPMYVRALR